NFVDVGFIDLYFAKEPMCQPDTKPQTYSDGLIRYFEATSDYDGFSVEIAGGTDRLKLLVETSDYPDRVSLGEINGMTALFIEPGIRNTLVISEETGELLETHENWTPGEIRVVDEKNGKYFTIIGDMPIKQLKTIMQNTLQ
ncbi:MAG: hypothetical protein O6761_00295, partial [Thaumarchaeota archaeon]|nr:hypothetical protein [Nitrososphaerota archaeon]